MSMVEDNLNVEKTALPGVLLIKPRVFGDPRGFFTELYRRERYAAAGIDRVFVQDNYSHSMRGVLRGMHYQLGHPQAKLVGVVRGAVFDVAVDVRRGSSTFGKWVGLELNDTNRYQLFVPEGFAHGFCVLSEEVDFLYKCSDIYAPAEERGVHYASFGIEWPVEQPIVSDRDAGLPSLQEMPPEDLPVLSSV